MGGGKCRRRESREAKLYLNGCNLSPPHGRMCVSSDLPWLVLLEKSI